MQLGGGWWAEVLLTLNRPLLAKGLRDSVRDGHLSLQVRVLVRQRRALNCVGIYINVLLVCPGLYTGSLSLLSREYLLEK